MLSMTRNGAAGNRKLESVGSLEHSLGMLAMYSIENP